MKNTKAIIAQPSIELVSAAGAGGFPLGATTSEALRERFLIRALFRNGRLKLARTYLDRAVVGGIVPTERSLALDSPAFMRANYFHERRESGVVNLGGYGEVLVDDTIYHLGPLDCLYIGKGARRVLFSSGDAASPARFYLVSHPAHMRYPTAKASCADALQAELGESEQANERVIYKYIHADGLKSCQLVMGFTELKPGSVWNTMPPHTHDRRTEIYCYFKLPEEQAVFHLMGEPQETRHLVVRNEEVVLSPEWSIHAGCGTSAYSFVWAMGGENQSFDDMDYVPIAGLR